MLSQHAQSIAHKSYRTAAFFWLIAPSVAGIDSQASHLQQAQPQYNPTTFY
jgi:hypothetical protein